MCIFYQYKCSLSCSCSFSLIQIFENNIIFAAKLLVTTGSFENSYENGIHSEVIYLDDEEITCHELANSAYPLQAATGGLVSGKPMICGGFYDNMLTQSSNKCFILGENQTITMAEERSYPSSISISRDKVSLCCILFYIIPKIYIFLTVMDHWWVYFKDFN